MWQLIWILTWTFLIIKGVYYPRAYLPWELSAEVFCPTLFYVCIYSPIHWFSFNVAAPGLHCSAWAFSSCSEAGRLFTVLLRLLIEVVSLVAGCLHRLLFLFAQALGVQISVVVAYGLSISCTLDSIEHVWAAVLVRWLNRSVAWGSSWTRVEPACTALEGKLPPLDHQAIPCPVLKLHCLCFWCWIVWAVVIVWK